MKNFTKSFLNTLYVSILLYFVSQFSTSYWSFIIPDISGEFGLHMKYFYLFMTVFPVIIWGCGLLKKGDIQCSQYSKILNILRVSFLVVIALVCIFLMMISIGASRTHNTGMGLLVEMIIISFNLFIIPFCWFFILILLKKEYGIIRGWGGLAVALICSYLFLSTPITCPADKPLKDVWGKCYSCDEKGNVYIKGNRNSTYPCENICLNRKQDGTFCFLPETCPPEMPLAGRNGGCFPCDTLELIYAVDCSVCPNRTNKGWCVLKECPPEYPIRKDEYSCISCEQSLRFIDSPEIKKNYEEKCK